MAKARTKTRGANVPVPQSREEAAACVARIGALNRDIARIDLQLKDDTAALKAAAEGQSTTLKEQVTALTEGLKTWAEANREALTGGKVKTVDLGTGVIAWRFPPPKVKGVPRSKEALVELIAKIKGLGFRKFIRVAEEVNKEAMLADPERAAQIPGISIAADGEEFAVEPHETGLSEGGAP